MSTFIVGDAIFDDIDRMPLTELRRKMCALRLRNAWRLTRAELIQALDDGRTAS